METLASYFRRLAKYEGTPATELVAPWKSSDVNSIARAFEIATRRARIEFSVETNTSVQALGNRVADAVVNGLEDYLGRYKLCHCSGQGYPDRRLLRLKDSRSFALELKAKTRLDPHDTQRIILTCATGKLRRNFRRGEPICHVLATALYSMSREGKRRRVIVNGLDLDFLEPWTLVQNQYQASVNQRLLAKGNHASRLLLWNRKLRKSRR